MKQGLEKAEGLGIGFPSHMLALNMPGEQPPSLRPFFHLQQAIGAENERYMACVSIMRTRIGLATSAM